MSIHNLIVQLEDDYGRGATKRFEADVADFAAMETATSAFLTTLAAITKLQIITYTIARKSAYSDSVTVGANRDAGITLSLRKTDGEKSYLKVPDPVSGVVLGDGNVDLTDAEVTAYVGNWVGGDWRLSDGEEATALLSGTLDS